MAKTAKRIWKFLGFVLSIWFVSGSKAGASMQVSADDLSASAARDRLTKGLDISRFVRTGEFEPEAAKSRFAMACLGYNTLNLDAGIADPFCQYGNTYFYSCN